MVRAASLTLNQQNGSKAIALGQYVANGGGIDGPVCRLVRYPSGTVVVTVECTRFVHELRYITLDGDLECEVLRESERLELARKGEWKEAL